MVPRIILALLSNPIGLVAVATPLIINHAQAKSASLKAQADQRAAELAEANKITDEVCSNMDKLAYFNKQAMFGIVFRGLSTDDDKAIWKTYQKTLMIWESSKTTSLAQTEIYFGKDSARSLKKIQEEFEVLTNQVDAAFFKRTTSTFFIEDKKDSKNDFRIKYLPVWEKLSLKMTDLSKEMIKRILEGQVGSFRPDSTHPS